MLSHSIVFGALALILSAPIHAENIDFSVTAKLSYEYGTQSGKSQSAEFELRPNWDLTLSDQWSFQGGLRLRTDAFDRLETDRPDQATVAPLSRRGLIGETTEAELRESFFQYADDFMTLRLGKQQIVWGRADGIKVLDIVNPQSFRKFILDDFDQSRTPLWSFLVERTVLGLDIQGFWIFDQTFSETPPAGSLFEITAPKFLPTLSSPPSNNFVVGAMEKPDRRLENSEFGAKISGLIGNWDFSLNYFHTFEDTPFYDIELKPDQFILTPRFNRVDIVGASFANSWENFTLRGEASLTFDENVPIVIQQNITQGPVEGDNIKYVIGLDYVGISNTFISAQFFQRINLNKIAAPTIALVPRAEEITTLLIRHDLDDGDWMLEFQWLANHDSRDGLIRSQVSHQLNDSSEIKVGGDFFYGKRDGVFGQFNDADRLTISYSYTF